MLKTVISVLIGAAITWAVARYYYQKAAEELKNEAARLQQINQMILRWLETDGKDIKLVRNDEGAPIGLARTREIAESISVSGSVLGGELKSVCNEEGT